MRPKAWLSWSSGKDSAWTLHEARRASEVEITALLTTVTVEYERVAMHGVREKLLEAQAREAGLPLVKVRIPSQCSNEIYERAMAEALLTARAHGVSEVVFGDLFLADLRAWREERLAQIGMRGRFPLWMRDTRTLAREMIAGGLDARVVCVDPRKLDGSFCGRRFDDEFLDALPEGVDPCGENGEFHTCAVGGPMFARAIAVASGDTVERGGFVFSDLDVV